MFLIVTIYNKYVNNIYNSFFRNPENNPEVDDRLREARRRAKNRQLAEERQKQLNRITNLQGRLRRLQVNTMQN